MSGGPEQLGRCTFLTTSRLSPCILVSLPVSTPTLGGQEGVRAMAKKIRDFDDMSSF